MKGKSVVVSVLIMYCIIRGYVGSKEFYSRYIAITGPLLRKLIARSLVYCDGVTKGLAKFRSELYVCWQLTHNTCFSINNYRTDRARGERQRERRPCRPAVTTSLNHIVFRSNAYTIAYSRTIICRFNFSFLCHFNALSRCLISPCPLNSRQMKEKLIPIRLIQGETTCTL